MASDLGSSHLYLQQGAFSINSDQLHDGLLNYATHDTSHEDNVDGGESHGHQNHVEIGNSYNICLILHAIWQMKIPLQISLMIHQ